MFADIEADVFPLVDSEDTYGASVAPELIRLVSEESLDIASRIFFPRVARFRAPS